MRDTITKKKNQAEKRVENNEHTSQEEEEFRDGEITISVHWRFYWRYF